MQAKRANFQVDCLLGEFMKQRNIALVKTAPMLQGCPACYKSCIVESSPLKEFNNRMYRWKRPKIPHFGQGRIQANVEIPHASAINNQCVAAECAARGISRHASK
jgi:hypothetical protein